MSPTGTAGTAGAPAGTAQILDGKATLAAITSELAQRVATLAAAGRRPGLGTVLVGEDPGSQVYVAAKHRDCADVGIRSIRVDLPGNATQQQVEDAVETLNDDPDCTGYIVQLPLPAGLDADRVLELIDPDKDADGLHPTNLGRLVLNVNQPMASPLPCTPRGIVELLLTRREVNATVVLCHTGTRRLAEHLKRADVVVAAAGVPGIVTAESVRPGAVVLDVGVTRRVDPATGKARLVGDVAPDVREVASWVAPNPGGVGPMTRAMLLTNVVEAAERA